jgi:hypothetical protein
LLEAAVSDDVPQGFLTDQKDLDQGSRAPLQVRDQSQLLERPAGEVLGLVHNKDRCTGAFWSAAQELSEAVHQGRLIDALGRESKRIGDKPQEVIRIELSAVDPGDQPSAGTQVAQQILNQRGLSHSGAAGYHEEALAARDGVLHVGLRPVVTPVAIAEVNVGTQSERRLGESVKRLVHY